MIISVDMTRMNKIKWVDKINMMACIETGIIGQDLEKELKGYGVCCGHEPVRYIFLIFNRTQLNLVLWEGGSPLEPVE